MNGTVSAYDVVLVGGGLANGLIAYRLSLLRPELRLLLLEQGPDIGGNHTWSFHDGDLTAEEMQWIAPFVVHRWPSYDVCFPERERHIATGYNSIASRRFAEVIGGVAPNLVRTNALATRVGPTSVALADGSRIEAQVVIDGRGQSASPYLDLGFQKFLGQEVELHAPHGLTRPIVMDATVPQTDGYRFVYVLPFDATTLLVEDTYYSNGATLEPDRLRASIGAYLVRSGWAAKRVVREEWGVLPIALGGDIEAFWREKSGMPSSGLAAALFHPTTGYSLPDAVRLADRVGALPDLSAGALFAATRDHSIRTWKERRFFRLLNRMLFLAGAPQKRYEVLQHFYRLPDTLVARFYAGRLRLSDKARILSGKPPVPVGEALRALASSPPRRHRSV